MSAGTKTWRLTDTITLSDIGIAMSGVKSKHHIDINVPTLDVKVRRCRLTSG